MKRKLPITFIVFVLSLVACTKTSVKTPSDTDKVFIRIENATAENFSNFTLNATEFGGITIGDTSQYLLCKDILPLPFANVIAINNNVIYIVDITPFVTPTPYLKNGNYLMKVVSDTSSYRYQASFIKE